MSNIILTELEPTGNLTLGSYLGFIKQIVKMQNEGIKKSRELAKRKYEDMKTKMGILR